MKYILIFFISAVSLFAQVKADDVRSFTLKNGMKIFVLEDSSIPNANMYFFYKVGSRNEYIGITGISHFFEHMMFNGAKKYGPKEFDRVMEANGGSNNAYTSENITAYTDWFPASSIEVMFDLEADRIANLNFDPKMIESERGVILSERNTGLENNPLEQLWQEVQATAFVAHSYMWPVIGWESDIKNWTKEDLENYFHAYYAPNNCVVVISGDVKLNEVKKLSEKYEYVSYFFFKNSVQKMEYAYVSNCSEFPDIRAVTSERPDVPIPCMGTSPTSKMSSFLHGIFKMTFFFIFFIFFSILLSFFTI